jgi:hypothetical protein
VFHGIGRVSFVRGPRTEKVERLVGQKRGKEAKRKGGGGRGKLLAVGGGGRRRGVVVRAKSGEQDDDGGGFGGGGIGGRVRSQEEGESPAQIAPLAARPAF